MTPLDKLLSLCKCGVHITVNAHRNYYETAENYWKGLCAGDKDLVNEVSPEVVKTMLDTNTIVQIQAYPETPVGFYSVYHYDINKAIEEAIRCLED
jgi:hypothetical protein